MSNSFEDFLVNDEENDLFYFESDHLALRGNKDYSEVLKTIVILCAQRERALKDFGKIVELRKRCIEDPIDTLRRIQNGEDLGIPSLMELPKLPVIDFSKFDVKVPENDIKMIYSDIQINPAEENKDAILNSSSRNTNSNSKAWTHEEQKRLEELLLIYPSEPIEIKRFQKIAAALGNRSVKQVTSRVQKYFIKLYKAGLPIPGRVPKKVEKYSRKTKHQCPRNQYSKYNHYLFKPSTFFPDLYVPVTMDDQDNVPGPSLKTSLPTPTMTNYLIPTDYQQSVNLPKTESELQLELLKRVKYEKLREEEKGEVDLFQHVGFRCDYCSMVPIIGGRWHCITCTDSIDFCTDCVVSQMYSNGSHPLNHTLVIFHNDKDDPIMPCNNATDSSGNANKNCDYSSDSSDDLESESSTDESSAEELETCAEGAIKEEKAN